MQQNLIKTGIRVSMLPSFEDKWIPISTDNSIDLWSYCGTWEDGCQQKNSGSYGLDARKFS